MLTTKERVDRLEVAMMELADAQMRAQVSVKTLSDEMKVFKDEMSAFKDRVDESLIRLDKTIEEIRADGKRRDENWDKSLAEIRADSKRQDERWNRALAEIRADGKRRDEQWGGLSRKFGTFIEDIVAPNIPRIARENFGWSEILLFSVRVEALNRQSRSTQEFDAIAVGSHQMIVNETKLKPTTEYVNEFIEVLAEIWDYFPDYKGKTVIPIFSSPALPENLVKYLTRRRIYAMAMGDQTMKLLNFHQVNEQLKT